MAAKRGDASIRRLNVSECRADVPARRTGLPAGFEQRQQNFANGATQTTEVVCYLPGVPRITPRDSRSRSFERRSGRHRPTRTSIRPASSPRMGRPPPVRRSTSGWVVPVAATGPVDVDTLNPDTWLNHAGNSTARPSSCRALQMMDGNWHCLRHRHRGNKTESVGVLMFG